MNNVVKLDKPDIIILPEYSIPLSVYKEITETICNCENIIIAGSHIDKKRYNVCPIIFNGLNSKKIYHAYKNNCSPFEKELGLVKNVGTAHLKFSNTKFGNILIKICYDVHFAGDCGNFKNVDILLVPSFNYSKSFEVSLKNKAGEYKLVAAYANTINNNVVHSNIFIPPNEGLEASKIDIKSFHKEKWENSNYLFSWDEIPGNDDERIIKYLKDELKIEWAKTENISKIDDSKTIIVSNNEKLLSLSLNDDGTKVNLKIDDGRVDEFTVKTENGKLNIYNSKINSSDEIFYQKPISNQMEEEFDFKIKHLTFNILELDKRREIKSKLIDV